MKTRRLIKILILVLAVLLVVGNCATIPKTNEVTELFIQEVKSGDYAEVKRILEEGADINAEDLHGYTALMWATIIGHTDIVRLLIEAGADVNAQDNSGYTALMEATLNRHTEIVRLLIEAGADVNTQTIEGSTALMMTSINTEIAKLLIEAGSDVNARVRKPLGMGEKKGWTALIYACAYTYPDYYYIRPKIVQLLIEAGADVNAQDDYGNTALMIFTIRSRKDTLYGNTKAAKLIIGGQM